MKAIDVVATVLLIVGGVNWGLVGAARFDLVAAIFGMHFGETSGVSAAVYLLVGVAALYRLLLWNAINRRLSRGEAVAGR